jgi:mRNA interferase HigB
MNIQNFKVIEKFARNHADSRSSLESWYRITRKAAWQNFADVRETFNSADIYKCCTIFDIGGNKYRLIAYVDYETQTVSIVEVLTHADYDKDKWKRHC